MSAGEKLTVALVGAGGRLGMALARAYASEFTVVPFRRAELDLGDLAQLRRTLEPLPFDLLINTAAQTLVDRCETEPEEAFALNAEAPRVLAEICSAKGARLLHVSTDYVFDGEKRAPYTEDDAAEPISVYGASKLEGERRVLAVDPDHLVARVSWVFGPDRPSFIDWVIGQALKEERVAAVADKISAPTYTQDIAAMLRPFFDRALPGGVVHLANAGACSWQEYGQWALDCCRQAGVALRAHRVDAITLAEMKNFVARRPIYTVLSTDRFTRLTKTTPRSWREAVADYVRAHVAV